jgi:hypothetical protein
MNVANMQQNLVYVINSEEEFANYFTCGNNQQIDFSTKTLLVAFGATINGVSDISTELSLENNVYSLKIEVTLNDAAVAEGWHIALVTDKINTNSVMLNVNIIDFLEPVNITLYDKDSAIIQQYIDGKWNLMYGKGGFTGDMIYYLDMGYTLEFTADKKNIISSPLGYDTIEYYWQKILGAYAGYNDSVYMMSPHHIVFDKIKNDTLIYHDVSSETIWCYLIKSQN